MSTRGTILFICKYKDDGEVPLVKIYNHYDSYLSGLGRDICEWLLHKKIINGIGANQFTDEFTNGFEDLATLFIADHKRGIGGLSVTIPTLDRSYNEWCDYNYELIYDYDTADLPQDGIPANDYITIRVLCWDTNDPIFVGSPKELLKFIEDNDGEE